MQKLTIIKVGGKIVEEPDTLAALIADFARIPGLKLLVHGGGRSATRIASQLGIEQKMVDGRRITDADTLRVVTMVYGGLVNKNIVTSLQAAGINAIGLTGADMDIIRSHRRPAGNVDYGFVGDVDRVDAQAIARILDAGMVPVIAPLSHDGQGSMLNTNADTIASEVACALAPLFDTTLTFCFEKAGVLADENDDSSVLEKINRATYQQLRDRNIIVGGMIPKLDNAFKALNSGVREVIITKADALGKSGCGTVICH
ncbi:MAG: acetylglutamate kinase [Muribaculaceae bacterium]|nr:acetylglutamate kinase [Muribaculaceae bacterium]